MLAQLFLARYPTGNLISELIEIYQGKFVVRVTVQVAGIVRVTSLAAAETIEQAEDAAQNRALTILGLQQPGVVTASENTTTQELQPTAPTTFDPTNQSVLDESQPRATLFKDETSRVQSTPQPIDETVTDLSSTFDLPSTSSNQPSWSNVTPLMPRNSSPARQEDDIEPETKVSPVDLSDALLKIDVTLKRLGWSADHEQDYLERTYNKRSRQMLTDAQVLEFQSYLEVLAQTGDQMKRLKWTTQQGKEYLLRTYNKRTRALLTYDELLEFLQYLESQPSLQETHT